MAWNRRLRVLFIIDPVFEKVILAFFLLFLDFAVPIFFIA
jgi:hypothetical protein